MFRDSYVQYNTIPFVINNIKGYTYCDFKFAKNFFTAVFLITFRCKIQILCVYI